MNARRKLLTSTIMLCASISLGLALLSTTSCVNHKNAFDIEVMPVQAERMAPYGTAVVCPMRTKPLVFADRISPDSLSRIIVVCERPQ